jgi:hypothetical protein
MKRLRLILLLIFCIACSIFINSIHRIKPEGFATKKPVRFMTKYEMDELIDNDDDKYISSMSNNDFAIRNVKSKEEYKKAVKESFCDIDENNKIILNRSCVKVDEKLKQSEPMFGVDLVKLSKLDWNIGCTCNNKYENGLPHTRKDVIILPLKFIENRDSENTLCRLLLHEKVHIYQKFYKKEFEDELVENQHFTVTGNRTNDPANPDLNGKLYSHSDRGKFYATYPKNPKLFSDITYAKNSSSFEHPFEWVAYEIEKLL